MSWGTPRGLTPAGRALFRIERIKARTPVGSWGPLKEARARIAKQVTYREHSLVYAELAAVRRLDVAVRSR